MAHAFPEKSLETARTMASRYFEMQGTKDSLMKRAYMLYYGFREQIHYGFTHQFYTGNYAPWYHEMQEKNISGFNCTTIIPYLYSYFEAFGVKPEIVQFFDWRDTSKHDTKQKLFQEASHFALILDVGKPERYLCDLFWKQFGAITAQEGHVMKLRNYPNNRSSLREFRSMVHYSAEEFAAMMERLHTPTDSLDVLVAGQRFNKERYNAVSCESMVYYDDTEKAMRVRVFIPQKGIQNKVVYGRIGFDDSGGVCDKSLRLAVGKDDYWNFVEEEKTIVRLGLSEYMLLNSHFGKLARAQKRYVVGLNKLEDDEKKSLLNIVDGLWQELSVEEQEKLRGMRVVRTLYESASLDREYVFSEAERDGYLRERLEKLYVLDDEVKEYRRAVFRHYGRFERIDENKARCLLRKKRTAQKSFDEINNDFNEFQEIRIHHKKTYHRIMDKVVFAKQFEKSEVSEIERRVLDEGGDFRVGYLAMIADFLPFVKDAKKDLMLELYLPMIGGKVKARMERDKKV